MTAVSLRPRERRLALLAAVVVGSWVLVSAVVQPLWDRALEVQDRVSTQREKLQAFSRLLEQAPAIERDYQRYAPFLSGPQDAEGQGAFLKELETLCRRSGLELNLKPRPTKPQERVNRFEVELDVEGSQANLLGFLDALLALPELSSIERLRISGVPAKEHLLRASLVIQHLALR